MSENFTHIPVMAGEIKELLLTDPSGVYMDGTLGLGGHTKYLLSFLPPQAKIYGFDKDINAVNMAVKNAADERLIAFNKSYTDAPSVLEEKSVTGALFDLGLSSYQLDDASRGFSFLHDGPLDMRFDAASALTAEEVVNTYPFEDLEKVFKDYGEEPDAAKIARAVIAARREKRVTTTKALSEIISFVVPRRGKTHPATNVFQALRIEVNGELKAVEQIGNVIQKILAPGGRAAVLTFHSLEDRIIKNSFRDLYKSGDWRLVNKKVIIPQWAEVKQNPRARSAKLRVIERIN